MATLDWLHLISVEPKRVADMLSEFLMVNNFPTAPIHGDRTQRETALATFRTGHTLIMVATAVAACAWIFPA